MTIKTAFLFDTETTGAGALKDATDPNNPKVIQLFAGLYEYDDEKQYVELDHHGNLLRTTIRPKTLVSLIVNQDVDVPKEAFEVHGIDRKAQADFGVQPDSAALVLFDMLGCADEIIAHNISFDIKIINHLFSTQQIEDDLNNYPQICTMLLMTPLCRLQPKRYGQYKWPKLIEAYRWMYGRDFNNAHDASADTLACAEIYFGLCYLQSIGKA